MMQTNRFQPRGIFISATDTGCGKTFFGALLCRHLYKQNLPVQPRKPAESGCRLENDLLMPEDGLQYYHSIDQTVPLDTITPYRFLEPVSPARAAQMENRTLLIDDLHTACFNDLDKNDILIVEGAGGLYSPMANDGHNADLAKALGLPMIIIASNQLGCINHTLLTLEAAKSQNIDVPAIILNDQHTIEHRNEQNNLAVLRELCTIPVLPLCYSEGTEKYTPYIETLDHLTNLMNL